MAWAVILRTPLIGMRTSRSPVEPKTGATYFDEPAAADPSPSSVASPPPAAYASTSARLTMPPSPDPATCERSIPRSLANLRTGGLARALLLPAPSTETGCAVTGSAAMGSACLLYTSDAADDLTRVDLGGRRIIK